MLSLSRAPWFGLQFYLEPRCTDLQKNTFEYLSNHLHKESVSLHLTFLWLNIPHCFNSITAWFGAFVCAEFWGNLRYLSWAVFLVRSSTDPVNCKSCDDYFPRALSTYLFFPTLFLMPSKSTERLDLSSSGLVSKGLRYCFDRALSFSKLGTNS